MSDSFFPPAAASRLFTRYQLPYSTWTIELLCLIAQAVAYYAAHGCWPILAPHGGRQD